MNSEIQNIIEEKPPWFIRYGLSSIFSLLVIVIVISTQITIPQYNQVPITFEGSTVPILLPVNKKVDSIFFYKEEFFLANDTLFSVLNKKTNAVEHYTMTKNGLLIKYDSSKKSFLVTTNVLARVTLFKNDNLVTRLKTGNNIRIHFFRKDNDIPVVVSSVIEEVFLQSVKQDSLNFRLIFDSSFVQNHPTNIVGQKAFLEGERIPVSLFKTILTRFFRSFTPLR